MPSPFPAFLRWPLWIVALGTGAKSFADNPLIGSRRLNALGLHRLRVRVAYAMTRWRRRLLSASLPAADREAFARDGYVEWRDVLSPDAFERLRAMILDTAWPARDFIQGHTITRRIDVDAAMLRAAPDLAALLRHPRWRGLMRYVAATRAEPYYSIQTIMTHRGDPSLGEDPQTCIHADAFHPSMKAWLFLTDVGVDDGPLTYVPGSHRLTDARIDWEGRRSLGARNLDRMSARGSLRIEPAELGALGLPPPHAFVVPANTLVVGDTFGFHARGVAAQASVRVELWAYSRRNPFLPWTGLNIGNLPIVKDHRAKLVWRLRARIGRWTGMVIPNPVMKRPTDP